MLERKENILALVVLMPVAACLLAGVAGGVYISYALNGTFIEWRKLPGAPEKIVRLAGMKNAQDQGAPKIYAETSAGKLLGANLDKCFSTPGECWKDEIQIEKVESTSPCQYDYDVQNMPFAVRERNDACDRFYNGASPSEVRSIVVLLQDGSLWLWRYEHWELNNLAAIIVPMQIGSYGLIAGLLLSGALFVWKKPWRW